MTLGLRFRHNYDVFAPDDVTSDPDTPTIHLSGVTRVADRRPVAIHVVLWSGRPWTGRFNHYTADASAISGVFSHPDPDLICVVAGGQAYVVNVTDPTDWEALEEVPITAVADIPSLGLVVFADFTALTAYSGSGRVWRTERLASAGIRLADASDREINGYAWSAPDGRDVAFRVDPMTGSHEGGMPKPVRINPRP